jgi:hypothetical protein
MLTADEKGCGAMAADKLKGFRVADTLKMIIRV